jgi:pyruvate,water dikinase
MYYASVPVDDEEDRVRREKAFLRPVRALHARGETLHEAVLLPAVRAGNDRLAAVQPDRLAAPDLAGHLEAALRWYEEAWVLHFTGEPWDEGSPIGQCAKLYRELTGEGNRWVIYAPFGYLHQKEGEAVAGLIELSRLVKGSPVLLALFSEREPADVLHALDEAEGGAAFSRRLSAFLDVFGLHCGASQGVLGNQVLPGWGEDPTLVVATVQRYVRQDLDALVEASRRAAKTHQREGERLRAKVADAGASAEQRAEFDRRFEEARRQVAAAIDHNYYMDSPPNALLHRALLAGGRRLASVGAIEEASDVWWLRAHEITAALHSLDHADRPDWRQLVVARKALYVWQRSLTPPAYLGAPPSQAPAKPTPASEEAGEAPPSSLLVSGLGAVPGIATGRVRQVDPSVLVPDVRPGDVFVASNCGMLWASVLPCAAAVVLDGSSPHEHAMRVCREFGIPAVVQARNASRLLRQGQPVTVDGGKGWVLGAD